MDYLSTTLISLVLIGSGAGLMAWHWTAWRGHQSEELEPRETKYRRGQYRRRMQTSAMLVVVGVAIPIGHGLTVWLRPHPALAIFWGGVVLLVFWMALLALADIVATQYHFSRTKTDYLIERAKLEAELRRVQSQHNGSNGHGKTNGKAH